MLNTTYVFSVEKETQNAQVGYRTLISAQCSSSSKVLPGTWLSSDSDGWVRDGGRLHFPLVPRRRPPAGQSLLGVARPSWEAQGLCAELCPHRSPQGCFLSAPPPLVCGSCPTPAQPSASLLPLDKVLSLALGSGLLELAGTDWPFQVPVMWAC